MTKKDYELIIKTIVNARSRLIDHNPLTHVQQTVIIAELAIAFQEDNELFSSRKFINYYNKLTAENI